MHIEQEQCLECGKRHGTFGCIDKPRLCHRRNAPAEIDEGGVVSRGQFLCHQCAAELAS